MSFVERFSGLSCVLCREVYALCFEGPLSKVPLSVGSVLEAFSAEFHKIGNVHMYVCMWNDVKPDLRAVPTVCVTR